MLLYHSLQRQRLQLHLRLLFKRLAHLRPCLPLYLHLVQLQRHPGPPLLHHHDIGPSSQLQALRLRMIHLSTLLKTLN